MISHAISGCSGFARKRSFKATVSVRRWEAGYAVAFLVAAKKCRPKRSRAELHGSALRLFRRLCRSVLCGCIASHCAFGVSRRAAACAATSLNSGSVPLCGGPLFNKAEDMRLQYRCHAKRAWLCEKYQFMGTTRYKMSRSMQRSGLTERLPPFVTAKTPGFMRINLGASLGLHRL